MRPMSLGVTLICRLIRLAPGDQSSASEIFTHILRYQLIINNIQNVHSCNVLFYSNGITGGGTYLGWAGKCCLLFGRELTVSLSLCKSSLLGCRPACSSSEGGPGSETVLLSFKITKRECNFL